MMNNLETQTGWQAFVANLKDPVKRKVRTKRFFIIAGRF